MIPFLAFLLALILSQVCHGQEQQQWLVISNGLISSAHDSETAAQQAAASKKQASPNKYVAYMEQTMQVESVEEEKPIFACFPGDATVQVRDKGVTLMSDLKLGDKVLTGNGKYESVYSFGHRNPDANKNDFLELTAGTTSLALTSDHMILLKGGSYVPSSIVQIGDELLMSNGVSTEVQSIRRVQKKGVFAPFTASGTIVVNDIHASSFISFQASATLRVGGVNTGLTFQFLAYTFEMPHRMWCLKGCHEESYTVDGISIWVDGPHRLARRLFLLDGFSIASIGFFAALATAYLIYAMFFLALPARRIYLKLGSAGKRDCFLRPWCY